MAFPVSPTNGQIYKNYIYNSASLVWKNQNADTLDGVQPGVRGLAVLSQASTLDADMVSAYGIGASAVGTGDCNSLTKTGFYAGVGMTGAPDGSYWQIEHYQYGDPLYAAQTARAVIGATPIVKVRNKDNGTWGNWYEIWTTANSPFVRARYYNFSAVTANDYVKYQVKDEDTHNAYSISTGLFTVPISGVYQIESSVVVPAAYNITSLTIYYKKTGSSFALAFQGTNSTGGDMGVSVSSKSIRCVAGDTLGVSSDRNINGYSNIVYNITITRIGG